MGYLVITVSICLLLLMPILGPFSFVPLLFWNLGFWIRFVEHKKVCLKREEKVKILLGIPINQAPNDVTGTMLQITAYLVLAEGYILNVFVQDQVFRAAIYFLLMGPSIFLALWMVKLIVHKLN